MNVRSQVLQFLRTPREFASTLPRDDDPIWHQGLEEFAQSQIADEGNYPWRESQVPA